MTLAINSYNCKGKTEDNSRQSKAVGAKGVNKELLEFDIIDFTFTFDYQCLSPR